MALCCAQAAELNSDGAIIHIGPAARQHILTFTATAPLVATVGTMRIKVGAATPLTLVVCTYAVHPIKC
jgi:hypothetical protein